MQLPVPTGPFRTTEAPVYGVSPKMLRGRRFVRLAYGVAMNAPEGSTPTLRQRVEAALLVLPADAVVIGVTGLRLRGVDVAPQTPLRFASRHPHPTRRVGLTVKRVTARPPRIRGPLPMATVIHCFLTATVDLDLVELVVAGDWLLRLKLTTREQLQSHLAASSERGVLATRRAAALLADRVDSPWCRLFERTVRSWSTRGPQRGR